jgi:ABC-type branched-subunit amino acid transport system substrate-binding protein
VRPILRTRAAALGLALLLGGVAACSSAPLPVDELAQGDAPAGTVIDPDTGQTVDAVTGEVVDPVTGDPVPAAGAAAPGAPGAPAAPGAAAPVPGQPAPAGAAAPGTAKTGGGQAPAAVAAPARSTLFTKAEERIGITDKQITMCAHAALTYGPAFNVTDADLNVFWSATNDAGGIFGRKVAVSYENDDYKATTAVTAARACKAKNIFMLLGGIGFDQIPAVRNWAEDNRMLYMHHTATVKGTKGQRFSFAPLPTVERTGEAFGQLYISKYKGKKVGIIKRDGENWEPGVDAFKAYLARNGAPKVVAEAAVPQNKGNYTEDILKMKNAGAEVVWIWENALGATQVVKQIKAQNYKPNMMLFPFNLTAQTLDADAFGPTLDGVAMFTAYSKGDYSGSFASYADDIRLFEAQYKKYRPDVDLGGVGGDLLFLNWTAQKALYHQLLDCGKDCNRNRFVDVLESYKQRPTSSVCPIDFTSGNRRQGSDQLVFMETYRAPGNKANWRNTKACVGRG